MSGKPELYWLHSHFLYWMGGTKYIYEVLKRLNHQYHLTVIVENASPYAKDHYRQAGINLISLDKLSTTSLFYWLTLPFQIIDTTSKLRRLIPKNSLVISSMFPMNVVATAIVKHPLQYCFEPFAFFHDPEFQKGFPLPKWLLLKLLQIIYGGWDILATKRSRHVITLNQVTQATIKDIYGRDSLPVYTGIDSNHFRRKVSKELKKKYVGKKMIVHSTDYTPVKGTDRMIRLFAQVKKLEPQAHLLITTTIDNPRAVQAYQKLAAKLGVADSIEFLGFVDYNLLPQLYSLAKVLVQCSYSDRSGTTSMALPVKESLACGTAAIRSPVTTEDVKDGVTGYLVDPRDEKEMVNKIIRLLNLPANQYAKLSKIARARIVKLYTWGQTAQRIRDIINA